MHLMSEELPQHHQSEGVLSMKILLFEWIILLNLLDAELLGICRTKQGGITYEKNRST
jgi:hypothetical protein